MPLSASTRCMLFTARIRWIDENHILIASGTAFGEVIIWSCKTSTPLNIPKIQTHYFYTAHEGSVFGISIWREKSQENLRKSTRLLVASSSDDRTIRVWDVSPLLDSHPGSNNPSVNFYGTEDSQNTQNAPLADRLTTLADPSLLAKTWAHVSRIWLVDFVSLPEGTRKEMSSLHLLSAGEDTTCRLWKCSIGSNEGASTAGVASLSHVRKVTSHGGKNIWSMCHALNKSGDFTIVSGGADGHAQICKDTGKVFGALKGQASVQGECSISGVGAQLTSRINEASALGRQVEDKFKSYSFVCDDGLLMVTSYGHVLFGKIQAPTSDMSDGIPANIFWTYITTCPDLGNSSLVVGVPVASIGFFTGASGKVYSFNSMTHVTAELIDVHSKPRAILADYVSLLGPNSNLICLFVSDSSGAARLLLMRENQLEDKQSIFSSLIVPVGKQDAIFSMKCHSARSGCLRLFLGTRTGKVMMYTWSEQVERSNPGSDDFKLNKTCIWTSHEDSITSLLVYESTLCDMGGPCQYLLTTARDGSYAIHKIEASDIDPTPVLMHRAYPPLGPNLEGAYFDNVNQHLILYGFRGIDFVGHDEALRKDVFTVDAGGAHRAWAFKPHTSSDGSLSLIFAWTRAGKLHFILPRNHGSHTFKSGGHGREIKACAIRPGQQRGCDGFKQIVATGAEDTHIRLFEHSHLSGLTERSGLDCISILTKHNTGVQQLQWSEDGDYLFSGGGCEEFFVWRIRRMPLLKVGVVCEASLNSSNHVSDLRITGVDVGSLDLFRDVMDHSTRRFKILLGFSNSTLRLYELSLSNSEGSWSQIWSSSYTSCCLTKSQFLAPTMNEPHGVSKNRTAHSDNILGAATDGHLVVLYPYASSTPPPAFQVHQNSIKALDKVSLPTTDPQKSVHVVLSGGDDNVLAITILTFDNTSTKGDTTSSARFSAHERNEHQSVSRETVILPRAHAASVSAVKILPSSYSDSIHGDEQHDTNRYRLSVASAGTDQYIKLWNVTIDANDPRAHTIDVQRAGKLFTPVADVSDMEVFGTESMCPKATEAANKSSPGLRKSQQSSEETLIGLLVCGVGMDVFQFAQLGQGARSASG